MITYDDILFILFGLPTWILVDGTWSALSQIAIVAPEGFNISSYLMLFLTCGNIFPLIIGNYLRGASQVTLNRIITFILSLGFTAGIFLSAFWSKTIIINGQSISLPLYIIFFIVGSCAASSNITHFMFISSYPVRATSMMSTGFGLGSMTAGLIGLLQGLLLKSYGVSLWTYYLLLSFVYIPAMIAFQILSYHRRSSNTSKSSALSNTEYVEIDNSKEVLVINDKSDDTLRSSTETEFLSDHRNVLFLQFLVCTFGYGMIPAIISFACSKFDHRDTILLLSTSISSASNPIFRILTIKYELKSERQLFTSTSIILCLASGVIICALLPANLSIHRGYGGVLPAVLYISFLGLFGYTNTCIFRYLKSHVTPSCVQHAYRWGGLAMQSGALVGSVTTFVLIVTKVFH